jgi:uncharacterized delta-60 repeat protein
MSRFSIKFVKGQKGAGRRKQYNMCKNTFSLILILCAAAGVFAQSPRVDLTFNGNGRSLVDFTPNTDNVSEVLLQSNGKIVLAGTANRDTFSTSQTTYFALTRLNVDGTLDTTFGDNGKVATDFSPAAHNDIALAAAIQPDDKIVLSGLIQITQGGNVLIAIMRFNADGSVDTSFGTDGKVTTSFVSSTSNEIHDVTVTPSGEIVVAGHYWNGNSLQTGVMRLSATGTILDTMTNFQDGGAAGYNSPNAVRVQPDGKIVTGGYFKLGGQNVYNIKLVRFNTNGTLDNTFGTGGVVWENAGINEVINDIELLPDGRIVACGTRGTDFLVMRFLPNGQLDPSFGTNGRVVTTFNSSYAIPEMVVRQNGKILLAGRSVNDIAVAYYNTDGTPDTSFDGDGKLAFTFGPGAQVYPAAVAVDNVGRVVLGGASSEGLTLTAFAATRLKSLDVFPVTVSGRAVTPGGTPIRNVRVGLTDSQGMTHWALTSAFGSFQFDNISTGQTCNVFVRGSKTHLFEAQDVSINGAVSNIELIGTPRTELQTKGAVQPLSGPIKKLR